MERFKIDISTRSVVIIIGVLGGIYVAFLLRGILILFLLAYILASAFKPVVNFFEQYKIPRWVTALSINLLILGLLVGMISLTIDTFANQLEEFINSRRDFVVNLLTSINDRLPTDLQFTANSIEGFLQEINERFNITEEVQFSDAGQVFSFLADNVGLIGKEGFRILNTLLEFLFGVFLVVVMSTYIMLRKENLFTDFVQLFPTKYFKPTMQVLERMEKNFGNWLLSELFQTIIIGTLTYIGFMLPHLFGIEGYELHRFALLLGLLAAFLELFPNIGPTFMSLLGGLISIALLQSVGIFIYIMVMLIIIQQLEGLLITPNLVKRIVHLDPILTIVGVIAGFTLAGILGAVLSVPVMAALKTIIQDVMTRWKKRVDAAT